MKKKRVFITGGTGYIGQNLALSLSKNLFFEVALIKRKQSKFPDKILRDKTILKYDFDGNISSICFALKKFKPHLVIHLAANVQTSHSSKNLKDIIDSNILFATLILEAMKICNIKNIINTGTYWQYQKKSYTPIALYAASKEAYEKILEFYVYNYDFRSITLILFDVYGSNDKRNKIVNYLLDCKDKKIKINLNGGEQFFYPVHIDDVIMGFKLASEKIFKFRKSVHQKFTLRPNEKFKLKDFILIFQTVFDCKFKLNWLVPSKMNKPYLKDFKLSFTNLPRWSPKIKIKEGLKSLS